MPISLNNKVPENASRDSKYQHLVMSTTARSDWPQKFYGLSQMGAPNENLIFLLVIVLYFSWSIIVPTAPSK